MFDSNIQVDVFGLLNNIGSIAENDFTQGLKKRGWNVFLEIKNSSENGIDVIAQHPYNNKIFAFEVKANTSKLSNLQKGNSYIKDILDEISTYQTLRKQKVDNNIKQTVEDILEKIKKYGFESREVRYNVDRNTGVASMEKMKKWAQCV